MSNVQSSEILVFPSTKRGSYQLTARLMTEQYMVNIINELVDADAFVITQNTTDGIINPNNKFEFNVHGYYFCVTHASDITNSSSATDCIYANIIVGTTAGYTELVGQDDASTNLYMGVKFTDDNPDSDALQSDQERFSLKILEKNGASWSIPSDSKLKFSGDSISGPIRFVDGGEV